MNTSKAIVWWSRHLKRRVRQCDAEMRFLRDHEWKRIPTVCSRRHALQLVRALESGAEVFTDESETEVAA